MNYEESVAFLGNWGPFQRRLFFTLCVCVFPSGFAVLSVIFLLTTPSFTCNIPPSTNLSQDWIQALNSAQGQGSCSRWPLDLAVNASLRGLRPGNVSGSEVSPGSLPLEDCRDGLNFSQQYFTSTVVTEFSLVCEDQWKQPLSSLVYFLGGLCGCFVCGQLSDRWGRTLVLLGAQLLLSVSSSCMAFAPSWPVFMVCFFMVGFGQITAYIVVFVLGSELLTGGARVFFSCLGIPFCYVSGAMLLPWASYLLPNWRHLSLAIATTSIVSIPFWWAVPESPRWLLSQGCTQKAEGIIRAAAATNGLQAPATIFHTEKMEKAFGAEEKGRSLNFWDLLRTRNIRLITVILWFIWLLIHVTYFGLSFNMSGLYGSPFLNYFLVSAIEVPAYVCSWLAAMRCPRRLAFLLFGSVGTFALLLILVTTHIYPAVTLALVLLGKFGVLAAISGMYIHTGELYPTIIRNTAMSSCAMFCRVGSSLSPYLQLLAVVEPSLPWLVAACLCLLSVVLVSFLPETFQQPLPDAIEQMARPQSLFSRYCCTSKNPETPPENTDSKQVSSDTNPVVLCTTRL